MSLLLFPDNTVLINFALIQRMDLLETLANGKGQWCASVADECHNSARQPGLEALNEADEIFGEPWHLQGQAEWINATILRDDLASPGDGRLKHLGEAETLAIMIHRATDGLFVTDDSDAARLANRHGIQVIGTWDLLRLAAKRAMVDEATLWGYVLTLRSHQRGSPPGVTSRATLSTWLE